MYIIIERNHIFHALQRVLGFVGGGRQQSLPILGHILLEVRDSYLFIIGTDIDMEVIVNVPIYKIYKVGQATAPARKFFDICRNLSADSYVTLQHKENNRLLINADNSYFSLVTFSSLNFPRISLWESEIEFFISQKMLKQLINLTHFSMGKQDVRHHFNGMLFEFDMEKFCTVTTDGHRLSLCEISICSQLLQIKKSFSSIIVPRKYVINIVRILDNAGQDIKLKIGQKNISIVINNYVLTSKLINGVFPNYRSVFPVQPVITLEVNSKKLKQAIKRAIILCNEKFYIVKFLLSVNRLKIIVRNSENEISEQVIDVIYNDRDMEIAFNVYYVLDVLNVIKSDTIRFFLVNENASVQIVSYPISISTYVIMPIRL